jgi:hypothetical protein
LDDIMSKLTFLRLSTAVCWPAAIFAAPLQAVAEPAVQHQHHTMHQHQHQQQQQMGHRQHQLPASQAAAVEPEVQGPTALAELMPAAMVPLQDWRQANQQVLRLGGWQFYLQEAAAAPVTPNTDAPEEQHHAHH